MEISGQIHLEALEQSKIVDAIHDKLQKGLHVENLKSEIANSIRFFGKNIAKLQECNAAILKLARIFLVASEMKLVEWSLRDSNAFLLMITSLLLKRKDELVVRQICVIMKMFTRAIPTNQLKNLMKINQKHIQYIFNKMSKVSTYFTQMKLLEILHIVFDFLDDKGEKVIKQEKLFATSSISRTMDLFHALDLGNFLTTSRNFLGFFNQEVIKSPFILSFNCFLFKFNDRQMHSVECIVDFNMRNLSISFYTKSEILRNTRSDSNYLIEVEECFVAAEGKKFNVPNYIELVLKPSRSQVLNEQGCLIPELSNIDSIVLVVTENTSLFWSQVLPMYETKTPMVNEQQTDMESMASFRTLNTAIETFENKSEAQKSLKKIESSAPVVASKISEDLFSTPELQELEKTIPARVKMEHRIPRKSLIETKPAQPNKESIYNNIPHDEESLPCAPKFFSLKRVQRQSQSQGIENTESTVAENPEDLTWNPNSSNKKRSAGFKKEQAIKKSRGRNKTNLGYSDVDEELKKSFGNEVFEPLLDLTAEPKRTPRPRAVSKRGSKNKKNVKDFDLDLDDNVEVLIVKTNAQLQREAVKTSKTQKKPLKKETGFEGIEGVEVDQNQDQRTKKPMVESFKKPVIETFKKPVIETFKKPLSPKQAETKKAQEKANNKKKVIQDRRSLLEEVDHIQKKKKTAEVVIKKLPVEVITKKSASSKPVEIITKKLPESTKRAEAITKKPVFPKPVEIIPEPTKRAEVIIKTISPPKPAENKKKPTTPPKSSTNLSDFDKLVKEKQLTIKRLTRKRPSVNEEETLAVKKARISPTQLAENQFNPSDSPQSKEIAKRQDLLDSDKENEPEFVPFTQHPNSQKQTKFDYAFYNSRPMLRKYIEEVETTMRSGQVVTTSRRFSQLIQNSDLSPLSQSQKKTSPTINICNVQIQAISISPPKDDEMMVYNNSGVNLGQRLENESKKSIGPLMQAVKNLVNGVKKPEVKQQIVQAVKDCRNSKERYRVHIEEHVKLLKRLHHSKRKLTHLFNEDIESIKKLRQTVQEVVSNSEKTVEENVQKVEKVRHEAFEKQKEVVKGVWGGYSEQVYRRVNNALKTHLNLDN